MKLVFLIFILVSLMVVSINVSLKTKVRSLFSGQEREKVLTLAIEIIRQLSALKNDKHFDEP